jgi:hypothetical protein
MCEHNRRRHSCAESNNCICDIEGCHLNGHRFAGVQVLLRHMRTFHSDNPTARTKGKEMELYQALQHQRRAV